MAFVLYSLMMNNNNPYESALLNLQEIHYIETFKHLHPQEILNLLIALGKHPNQENILLLKKIIHECTIYLRPDFNMAYYFNNSQHIAFLPLKNISQKHYIHIARAAILNPKEFCVFLQSKHPIEEKNRLIEYISHVLHRIDIESENFISTVFFNPRIKLKQFPKLCKELARFFNDEHSNITWQIWESHPVIALEDKLYLFQNLLLEAGSYSQRLNLLSTFLQSQEDFEIKQQVFLKLLNHYSFSMSRTLIDSILNPKNGLTKSQKETLIIDVLNQHIPNPVWVNAINQMQLSFNPNEINPLFKHCSHILSIMNYQELNLLIDNPDCSFSLDWPNKEQVQNYIAQKSFKADNLLNLNTFYRLTVFLEFTWATEKTQYQTPYIELLELGHELIPSVSEEHQKIIKQLAIIMHGLTEDRLRSCGDLIETGLIYQHWFPDKREDFLFRASRMISAVDSTPFENIHIMRCMLNTSPLLAISYGKLYAEDFQKIVFSSDFVNPQGSLLTSHNQYYNTKISWENQIHAIECLIKIEGINEKLLKRAIQFIPHLFPFLQMQQHMLLNTMIAFAEMLHIDLNTFSQIDHHFKRYYLLEHFLADSRFQLEDPIATIKCYLPLLKNPLIDFEFKLFLIPYLYERAPNHDPRTNDIRLELVEVSIFILLHTQMNPLKIHALYNHHAINEQIALFILNNYHHIDIRFLIQLGHIYYLSACLVPEHPQFKELLLQQLFIKVGIHQSQTLIAIESAEKLIAIAPHEAIMIGDRLIYLLNNILTTHEKIMIGNFLLSHHLEIPNVLTHFEYELLDDTEEAIEFRHLLDHLNESSSIFKRPRL
ncbi:MAG: hypothetical protein EBQ95_01280 [Gammaproteobacteria bacterium]|nr:hypothetical protein [Gammaproteobacteria bacterium]